MKNIYMNSIWFLIFMLALISIAFSNQYNQICEENWVKAIAYDPGPNVTKVLIAKSRGEAIEACNIGAQSALERDCHWIDGALILKPNTYAPDGWLHCKSWDGYRCHLGDPGRDAGFNLETFYTKGASGSMNQT